MKRLDEGLWVAGQIMPADLPGLKAAGITIIINNRPDGEEPGQPSDAALSRAAEAIGIAWHHLPMAGGVDAALIDGMAPALASGEGGRLAFCRSGTRSTYLWALAEARGGADPATLREKAAAAGYDLSPIAALIDRLAAR